MLKNIFFIFLGGGLGASLRYLIAVFSREVYSGNLPLGTFISNFISCVLLAAIIYGASNKISLQETPFFLFAIVGFCGGLSTFSTFSYETFELLKEGFLGQAILNIAISLLMGLLTIYYISRFVYK